jgi:CRP-like cAMP-binding protein
MNETSMVLNTLFLVLSLFYIISHYLACLYLYSAKVQNWYFNVDSSGDSQTIYEYETMTSLISKSYSDQYMSMIYWSSGILSTSGYSNLFALSTFNKLFSVIILALSHLFTIFLYAVSTKVSYMLNIHYVNYIGKTQELEVWMANKKLSEQLKKKVNEYYLLLWNKSSGFHKEYILKDLPKVLKQDILNYLFSSVIESGLFPDQLAPLNDLINKCRVEYHSAEEVIISHGELVSDTYFVIEGCVKVINSSGILFQKLFKGCCFCEEFLVMEQFGLCLSSYVAETDLRLAALSVQDFRGIIEDYPEFGFEVKKGIDERSGKVRGSLEFGIKEKTLTSLNDTNLNILTEFNRSMDISPTFKNEVPMKSRNFSCRGIRKKAIQGIYWAVLVWNAFYFPWYVGTFNRMTEVGLFFEALTLLVYYFYACSSILKKTSINKKKSENEKKSFLSILDSKIIYHLIAGFPVLIISDLNSRSEVFLTIFGIFRLLNVYLIPERINKLTRYYISWYITLRLTLMIFFYIYSVHITACFFIMVGRQNPSKSWFALIDSNSDYEKYVFAAYWASTTLSHTSFGDTQLHTNSEKTFAIFAFFMGWIIYCLIFGTICSILLGFSSKLKTNLQLSYEHVKNVLKKKKVFKFYGKAVESFYNYHWESNKGINEKEFFEEMNKGLRVTLQVFIYSKAIIKSQIFKESQGELDIPLTRSIFSLMKLEYYAIGESLIKVGDRSQNMFILLEGQVDVLNLKGTKVLATLKQGSHFGEANIILKNDMRTASILATEICTVGILEKEVLEILFEAFPHWYTMLETVVKERMEKTFNSSKISDVNRHCQTIFEKIFSSPMRMSRYTIRSEKLIAEKIADIELKHTENQWYSLFLVHFVLLVYSAITLPLFIGFYFQKNWVAIGIEAMVIVESLVFLLKNTNFKILLPENRRFSWSGLVKYYYHNHVFEDLAALSPFHLAYMLTSQNFKAVLVPLSLIRLFALFRLSSILEIVEFSNRKKIWFVKMFKVLFTVCFIIHGSTCLWHFCVKFESPSPWIDYYHLPDSLTGQYRFSLFYVVNIITSTGFNNTSPRSTTERLISLLISINGIAFFSIIYSNVSSSYSKKHPELFKMIKKIKSTLRATSQSGIPDSLKSRIQEFYTFSSFIEKRIGGTTMNSLYLHLPSKLVKSIIFKCNKYMLKKLPILASITTAELIERLSLHLEPLVFLTDDFIIYKNDKGNEMYFILIGSVNILAQDNQKVLKTLKKGEFFGELALVNDTTRMCSVVASKPSLIYSLKKEVFLAVIESYPDLFQHLKNEGDKRKTENTLIKNNQNDTQSLKNSMFSAISRTFFARQQTCRMVQLMTGMKQFSPNVVRNCLDSEARSRIHTRRPQVQSEDKRRASQENILNDFNY